MAFLITTAAPALPIVYLLNEEKFLSIDFLPAWQEFINATLAFQARSVQIAHSHKRISGDRQCQLDS